LSFYKNWAWDDGIGISWDVARAFLTEAASMVLMPDLVYSSSNGNHDIGGPFRHFGIFSSLTALMIKFV
jgi:hypothetical protein